MRQRTKLFIDFLKENNCYAKFKDNFYRENPEKDFAEFMCSNIYNILIIAFSWSETPEGREYWRNMNYKWVDFLSSNQLY